MAPIHHPAFWSLLTQAAGTQALPDWATAEHAITAHAVQAGGTVFLQGLQHPYVYAVQAGLFKLSYLQDDGTEWIKSFAEEGRFFASVSALQPGGRTAFMVTAIEPATLERIDHGVRCVEDPLLVQRLARERMKGQTMAFHALDLVRQGRTSLAEALRVGFDVGDSDETMG